MPGSRLCLLDRVEIQVGIAKKLSDEAIGLIVSKDRTTVRREIRAGGGRSLYCADTAQTRAERDARRPKQLLLATDPGLLAEVEQGLTKKWSPASISMGTDGRICPETIYRAVYAGQVRPAQHRSVSPTRVETASPPPPTTQNRGET